MLRRFLDDADVGLAERGLELREHFVRFGAVCTEEPFERIEGELLDREDGEGACPFAALLPAHTVGHEKQVCALLASLQLRFRQARLPDAHRFCELRDQELILIVRAHLSFVGDPKGRHR